MEIGVIYIIVNPNGRIYIGQTENFRKRISQYKEMEKLDKLKQPIIGESIKKYGLDKHNIDILENNIAEDDLNFRESYWIEFFKSNCYKYPNLRGMNCTEGGDFTAISDEVKRKLSENSKSNIEIYQYDLDGNFIKEWRSATFASKELKVGRKGIQNCLDKIAKTSANSQWSFTKCENVGKYIKTGRSKPVNQILNGEIVKTWESCNDAYRNGFSPECIRKVCIGKSKTHKGFEWSYVNENDINISDCNPGIKKQVECIYKNQEIILFNGIKEASDTLGISRTVIQSICTGYIKQKDDYTLNYKKL